jgi:hypothetical protein
MHETLKDCLLSPEHLDEAVSILVRRKKMDALNIAEEIVRHSTSKETDTFIEEHSKDSKPTVVQCSSKFRKCLMLSCYIILMLIFLMELFRSVIKDGDMTQMIQTIGRLILNVTQISPTILDTVNT